ncbi:MAG: (d)CMP kinase [Clostridiales bacterium]|jgi:cytidylate kinase|nr:(d)CMP kinase [Clostridiales bacterium]
MLRMHIAIDGPAGAGKSTIAKAIAQKLHILHLDTGAMYRTLALFALQRHVDPNDAAAVAQILPGADIRVAYQDGLQRMLLNGADVTDKIRTPEIGKGASDIAAHPAVREKMVKLQQIVANENDVVMDGRDIGTVVMPRAKFKFYVSASSRVRAERRLHEFREKSIPHTQTLQEIEEAIIARDYTDSHRRIGPLRQADDAVFIDTTHMNIEQSVQAIWNKIVGGASE